MSAPMITMPDGALKRQGDSLVPQGAVCRVKRTSDVALANAYTAPIPFESKDFDPWNWFDLTTNRFTPKYAGFYRCTAVVVVSGVTGSAETDTYLRKNGGAAPDGASVFTGNIALSLSGGWAANIVSGLVYLNGSTDYVDVMFWAPSAGSLRGTAGQKTFFDAELIGISVGVTPEPTHIVGATGEIGFQNGWRNQSTTGRLSAGYYKDPNGRVWLQGTLDSTVATATTAFTLPAGYRPSHSAQYASEYYSAGWINANVYVLPDGSVQLTAGADTFVASTWFCIDGMSFRAEQ